MRCTKCGAATKVIETRQPKKKKTVTRRRECLDCKHRFTTKEVDINIYRIAKMNPVINTLPLLARELVRQHLLVEHTFSLVELDSDFTNLPANVLQDYRQAEADFLNAAMLTKQHYFQINYDGQPFNIRCDSDFEEVAIDFPVLLGVA